MARAPPRSNEERARGQHYRDGYNAINTPLPNVFSSERRRVCRNVVREATRRPANAKVASGARPVLSLVVSERVGHRDH